MQLDGDARALLAEDSTAVVVKEQGEREAACLLLGVMKPLIIVVDDTP